MERIRELLSRLADLTRAELEELDQLIRDEAPTAAEAGDQDVLRELRDGARQTRERHAEVVAEEDARAAETAEMLGEITGQQNGDGEGEGDEENGNGDESEEGERQNGDGTEEEANAEQTPEPEPARAVAAAATEPIRRPPIGAIAAQRPARHAPQRRDSTRAPLSIVAAADVAGHSAGDTLEVAEVGRAFAEKANAVRALRGGPGRWDVATFRVEYPPDRILDKHASAIENEERIQAVTGPQALAAAGGLCAPTEAFYDLDVVATAERPVRDALASFQARRGGARWITPPQLSDLEDAIGIWTAENDAEPTDPTTKPCLTITCGEEVEVTIDAVTLCLRIGNFSRMTFPEQFQAWYQLALAQHARVAEGKLLDEIAGLSTAVTDGSNLGAARDILESWGRAAAQQRSRHRMSRTATIQVLSPSWTLDLMRADLIRELPGAPQDRLALADSTIQSFFGVHNLAVSWYLDTETGEGQVYAAQGVGALLGWQTSVVSYHFTPGSLIFLDGGELNLGTEIRDTTLIGTNDVQAFLETFEALAFRGAVTPLRMTNTVCVNGATGATVELGCEAS